MFTHLLPEHIAECFEHVGRIMHRNSIFFFTFREAEKSTPRTEKDFDYPYSIFTELAAKNRLVLDRMFDYPHPRGQSMVRATAA
ncbi:MAG: hypothetical protein IT539_04235 [Bradyrhizobiaceae bacterium]|nr:hypothetical protein [Bradyrhizobiaceae bacterium]